MGSSKKPDLKHSHLQFTIALAVGVLFGVFGAAGVIPLWLAVGSLAVALGSAAWALWRSQWLSSRKNKLRSTFVLAFVVVYGVAGYSAVARILQRSEVEAGQTGTVTQKTGDCGANVAGGTNSKVSVNCTGKEAK